jgi:hypothetical protein
MNMYLMEIIMDFVQKMEFVQQQRKDKKSKTGQ